MPPDQATPQLWVENPAHAALARSMIDEYLQQNADASPWNCDACGEENPGSFELCWSCGV